MQPTPGPTEVESNAEQNKGSGQHKVDIMFTLIRNGYLYTPDERGKADLLLATGKIAKIADRIDFPESLDAKVVEADGKIITPGFIDLHVHIIGGGGEGGPATRVPEIQLSRITTAGVTTVVGVLGTDDVTRHPESLLAKAQGLEQEGISAYMMTGSYQFPPPTITGSVRKDIALIPHVVGVGEIALSDHRSSQPTFEEFVHLVAEARVGGLMSGKAGVVQVHMGEGKRGLEYLFRLVEETEIPITQVFPTHVTRTPELIEEAIRFARMGGHMDITASGEKLSFGTKTGDALRQILSAGVPIEQISLSSDSNGSMPVFNEKGSLVGLAVGEIGNLLEEFRALVTEQFPVPDILKCLTLNAAGRIKKGWDKGSIEPGKDADILVFDPDWTIDRVYCKGKLMVSGGDALIKGTFE